MIRSSSIVSLINKKIIEIITILILFTDSSFAEVVTYDLPALLKSLDASNLELQTEEMINAINDAEYKRIMKEFNPKLNLMIGIGPMAKSTGNALSSETDLQSWGLAYIGKADFTWPLYSWGRRKLVLDAMKAKKRVDGQGVILKKNEIIYNLKEAYYSTLYAYSLLNFVEGIEEKVDAKRNGKRKIKKVEKYQLDIVSSQIKGKKEDILKGQILGLEAVKLFAGIDSDIKLDKDYIQKESRELNDFSYYWNLAILNKPELIQLREGLIAQEKYKRSQEKELLPSIGVLVQFDFSHASNAEKQQSTFAYDPYNRQDFSMGVGFKWNLDFGVTKEKIRKTGVEIKQLKRKQQYADRGLKLLVRKSWQEVDAASKKLKHARKAYKSGKKWVNRLASSWSMGLTTTKKLVEAYQTYGFASKEYYEAILKHHLAWALLSKEVGVEVDPLLKKDK